jgi:RimJ/RimL family protein N-acetyltransferase
MSVVLRPARGDDVAFLVRLVNDPEVSPYLAAVRARDADAIAAEVARAAGDTDAFGVLVVEAGGRPVGTVTWERVNRRSAIASVSGLAIVPAARGRGVAREAMDELLAELFDRRGFHRVELEVYGFNDRAGVFFERVGFVREGVRRRAYRRDDGWVDGLRFGMIAEDR